MKIAIDKDSINKVDNKNEYIYVFDKETLEELLKLNLHCIHKDYIYNVDKNFTKYNIETIDKKWLGDKRNYNFAIIVPNYNNDHGVYKGKTYLQNCIESVLNQTYKNYYLIIVDDISTDTSIQTIEKYRNKEEYIDKIHLIQNKRKRYNGGSRNVGIDYAKENLDVDYICFIDSDDWWKNDTVLEHINDKLCNHEMMIIGNEMLFEDRTTKQYNKFDTYEDVYFSINKVWCTAWCRVIRIDKIAYFCEDTLMEDRVWSYKQADNCDFNKIINLNEICYVWNRLNTSNSVSMIRGNIWDASAWCHIGHQLQFRETMKHKEFRNRLDERIQSCIAKANSGIFQQY